MAPALVVAVVRRFDEVPDGALGVDGDR